MTAAVTSWQSCSKCWRSLASRFADEKVGSEVMDGSCPVKGTVAGPSPLDEPSLNLFAPERSATPATLACVVSTGHVVVTEEKGGPVRGW